MSGGYPLGYVLPIGLSLQASNLGNLAHLKLLRESVITVTVLPSRLARNLSTKSFPNLSTLKITDAESIQELAHITSRVLKSSPSIKHLEIDDTSVYQGNEANFVVLPQSLKCLTLSASTYQIFHMFCTQSVGFPALRNLAITIRFTSRLDDHWVVLQRIVNQVSTTLHSLKLEYNAMAVNTIQNSSNRIVIPNMPLLTKLEITGVVFELKCSAGSPTVFPMLRYLSVCDIKGERLDDLFKARTACYSRLEEVSVKVCPDLRFPLRVERITTCLVNCTRMSIAMFPAFSPLVLPSHIFKGMPQLTHLNLQFLDEFMNFAIPDTGNLEMMLTGLDKDSLENARLHSDTWAALSFGPNSLTREPVCSTG